MKNIVALRPKMNGYLTDNDYVDQKSQRTKKCVIKRDIEFEYYK